MPLNATLTEDIIARLAPDEASLKSARDIVAAKRYSHPGTSGDGSWLLAEFPGSGSADYVTSVDFTDPERPLVRCTCPSRKVPCKHGIALMLLHEQMPDAFRNRVVPIDLVEKREKKKAQDTKRIPPKKANRDAADKKLSAQKEGLDLLSKLLTDLVAAGQWFEESRLDKMERLAKQLSDAFLPEPMYALRRLYLTGKAVGISEEERMAVAGDLFGLLHTLVERGRSFLSTKLAGEGKDDESSLTMEHILGRTWQYQELKSRNLVLFDLNLMELAFERIDDEARQQRLEISDLLDLEDGTIRQAITYRPFKGLGSIPEQTSWQTPIFVREAVHYPGFVNRRVRWEDKSEEAREPDLAKAHSLAQTSIAEVLNCFRAQLKHPLAPREMVALIQTAKIGESAKTVVIEDALGARLTLADRTKDYSPLSNFRRAAGMASMKSPSVLVRLYLQPLSGNVLAAPLALLNGDKHLRVGI